MRISLDHARALWLRSQRLSTPAHDAAGALRAAGWWNSAGGSTVALSMRARGVSIENAVASELDREEIVEVPGVRRSTFLVPREDAGVALAASERATRELMTGAWRTAGSAPRDIATMKESILEELSVHPLSIGTLGKRVPPRAVRKTGRDGGALALPSTVHLALRELQHEGLVVRIPEERRLDGDRYLWKRASLPVVEMTGEKLDRELVQRAIRWAGPATLKEIAWWADITQKSARVAMETVGAASVEVEGWNKTAFVDAARLDSVPVTDDAVILLPFRDSYLTFRRGLAPLLSPAALEAPVLDWRGKPARVGTLDALHHPAIVVRGRLVGIWEFDPAAAAIVWRTFEPDPKLRRSVARAIADTEAFIRDELGDSRFYPFDSGDTRRARIADCLSP